MILNNKNAIITGCIQGIGKATVEEFAKNGANIWACALEYNDAFETYCKELSEEYNVWIKPVYFNLLNQDEIKIGLKQIASDKLPIDILVNIAGMTKDAITHMVTMDQMKLIFEINFFSQIYLTQFVTKLMIRQGYGSVVNTSSISAIDGSYGQLSYSSSKAALIGATKTLSKELASKGIRVNAIAPGVISTDMNKIVPDNIIQENIKKMKIKRLGNADEVAKTILFLASDLSNYITGQIIRIDGGIK
jgi:3-oxoacyl-[acyl-carrier protein] reductase